MTRDFLLIDDLGIIVYYTQRTVYYATDEEGPGIESMLETNLDFIDFDLFGESVNILPCLSEKQKEQIVRTLNEKKYE